MKRNYWLGVVNLVIVSANVFMLANAPQGYRYDWLQVGVVVGCSISAVVNLCAYFLSRRKP